MTKKLVILLLGIGLLGILNAGANTDSRSPVTTIFNKAEPGLSIIKPVYLSRAEDTLHYDGPQYTSIGASAGGLYYPAVRFTPVNACSVKSVLFYYGGTVALSRYAYIRNTGTATTPGAILESVPYSVTAAGWYRLNFSNSYYFGAGIDFWLVVGFNHAVGQYPIGADAGPQVPGRNFRSFDGGATWGALTLAYNYNIRAIGKIIVASSDVGLDAILYPTGTHRVNTQMVPMARVKNYGTTTQIFEVVCSIVSTGGNVRYTNIKPVPSLAAGDTARVSFDAWTPSVTEVESVIMRTTLTGDQNPANNRKSQAVSISTLLLDESFTGTTFLPTGWTSGVISGSYNWERYATEYNSPPACAMYNSYLAAAGSSAWLQTPLLNLTATTGDSLVFFWRHHSYSGLSRDTTEVQISTDNGGTWTPMGVLTDSTIGWVRIGYTLDTYPQSAQTYIRFIAHSRYDNRMMIDDIQIGPRVGIEEVNPNNLPTITVLNAPKPNPVANGLAHISFTISEPTKTNLKIYDASGKLVRTLVNAKLDHGVYNLNWNGTDDHNKSVAEGIYFYTLQTDKQNFTKKLVFTR